MSSFVGGRIMQPQPPALPRAPVAPAAPRPGSGSRAPRPGSQRSVGSAATRLSTSSQSTPEPDADIGEDDCCAVYSSDDAALDAGWGGADGARARSREEGAGALAEALAAAENRIRALEKQIQTERRLRKGAEDALAQTRSKLSTPVQQAAADRATGAQSDAAEDLLMDVGVQTDKQLPPGRQEIEREIEAAVQKLQQRNDQLEIENQMLQSQAEEKDKEILSLKADNKVLWGEQEAVRTAKNDFQDLQKQLASHVKAGNLITKRPSSSTNRVYAPAHDGMADAGNGHFSGLLDSADRAGETSDTSAKSSESQPRSPAARKPGAAAAAHPSPERNSEKQPESALSNFMGIFRGSIEDDGDALGDDDACFADAPDRPSTAVRSTMSTAEFANVSGPLGLLPALVFSGVSLSGSRGSSHTVQVVIVGHTLEADLLIR